MPERTFYCRHKTVRHADAVRERADNRPRLAQGRDCAGIKAFVRPLQLFEHMQPGTLLGLLLQIFILLL